MSIKLLEKLNFAQSKYHYQVCWIIYWKRYPPNSNRSKCKQRPELWNVSSMNNWMTAFENEKLYFINHLKYIWKIYTYLQQTRINCLRVCCKNKVLIRSMMIRKYQINSEISPNDISEFITQHLRGNWKFESWCFVKIQITKSLVIYLEFLQFDLGQKANSDCGMFKIVQSFRLNSIVGLSFLKINPDISHKEC